MLCHLAQASFAVLPPSHDTLTIVDSSSNITRLDCLTKDVSILGYQTSADEVLVWSKTTGEIKLRKASTGAETMLRKLESLSSLTRLGTDSYVAFCEKEEEYSINVLRGPKLEDLSTVFTQMRTGEKIKKKHAVGPTSSCTTDQWDCAVMTRKGQVFVVRSRRRDDSEPTVNVLRIKVDHRILSVSSAFVQNASQGQLTVCVGFRSGKINVIRLGANEDEVTRSELHWHSGPCRTLCLIDENHLVSGGEEGVIVLWRLDRGTNSQTFRPRLGAAIIAGCVIPSSKDLSVSSCLLLLNDGNALEVEIPTLVLNRRIRSWIPSNAFCCVSTGVLKADESSRYLAVALDNHRPGALTLIDADLRDSTSEERIIDVAARNAVSTADVETRWKVDLVQFSPDGRILASVLSASSSLGIKQRKRELRVFFKEQEVLRVPMAFSPHLQMDQDIDVAESQRLLAVTNASVAVADPNAIGKIVLFKSSNDSGDFVLERILDVEPQRIIAIALSDDDSCVCALTLNGLVRVWNRSTAQIVLCRSVGLGCDPMKSGLGITKSSKEIFVWNQHRITALMSGWILNLGSVSSDEIALEHAVVSPALDYVAYLRKDEDGKTVSLFTWSGRDEDAKVVHEVEPSEDWRTVDWAGATVGWVLKRSNGAIQTRGGRHTSIPKRRDANKLPTVRLHRINDEQSKTTFKLTNSNADSQDTIFSTAWCKGLPSHLLQAPPGVSIVWPSWEIKKLDVATNGTATPQQITMATVSPKKRAVQADQVNKKIRTGKAPDGFVVKEETPEERAMYEDLFKKMNKHSVMNGE